MAQEAERTGRSVDAEAFEFDIAWQGGALSGLVATVLMGIVITLTDVETLRVVIAGLYGFEGSLVVGWASHLVHGTLFGVLFAVVLSDPSLHRLEDWLWKSVVAGVVYGLSLAVIAAGVLMPIWLGVAGVVDPPSIPNVSVASLLWHAVYGLALGAAYPFAADLRR